MKEIILLNLLLICILPVFAQDLTNIDQVCPSTPVQFNSPGDPNAIFYDWDFCTGDLQQQPDGFVLTSFASSASDGIEIVRDDKNTANPDDDEWFGFVTNSRNNNLIRINFGSSLDNPNPTTQTMNISIQNTYEMAFVREEGKWFAVVARNINNPILIAFDSLNNNNPTVTQILDPLGNFPNPYLFGGSQFTLKLRKDGDNLIGIFLNSLTLTSPPIDDTRMIIVNFGNSVTNPVTLSNLIEVPNIGLFIAGTTASNPGFDIIQDGENWYGVTCGLNNIRLLEFGDSLYQAPTVTDITANITGLSTSTANVRIRLVKDGNKFLAFMLNTAGQLLRLDFGENMNNTSPVFANLGRLGALLIDPNFLTTTFDLEKEDSEWKAFIINRNLAGGTTELVRANFPNPCNAEPVSSNENDPDSIIFLLPETEYINLTTYDESGFVSESFVDELIIQEATVGNFDASNQCFGETVVFDNFSFGSDENVASWNWDFGDGTLSALNTPSHTYAEPGSYLVSLQVINKSGCENTIERIVNVTDIPNADFIVKSIDCDQRSVEFEDLSALSTRDLNAGIEIVTREWLFGDNTSFIASTDRETGETRTNVRKGESLGSNIAQAPAYPKDSVYRVSLTIINSENCVSTISKNISFRSVDQPVVDFEFDQLCTGNPAQFRDLSTMSSEAIGTVDTWRWKVFTNDGVAVDSSTLQDPTFVFDLAGTYTVELSAQFSGACPAQISKEVQVIEGLTSQFNVSTDIGIVPLRVVFESTTANASSFAWNFGDGRVSVEEAPIYTYTEPGVYIVEFQARNENNCGTTATRSITVLEDEQVTSQEPVFAQNIKIFPNPTEQKLFINFEQALRFSDAKIELMDAYGKILLLRTNLQTSDFFELNLETLSAGIYFLRISSGGQSIIRRINKI